MAKKVFFSFHYQDVIDFRANVVRSHWVTKPDREQAGYFDKSIWEESQKQGSLALKRMINGGLDGTSNTCVLIGSQTYARPWVRYEIFKSFLRGNHLLGVHINGIKGKDQLTKKQGPNPFAYLSVTYAADGRSGILREWDGAKWVDYTQIDGSATFSTNAGADHKGKTFELSRFYKIYDWNDDDGFNKFANWLV